MKSRRMVLGGALLSMLMILCFAVPQAAHAAINRDPAAKINQLFNNLNKFRAQQKLGAVKYNSKVGSVASDWTAKMADKDNLSHNPNYVSDPRVPDGWAKAGEIIAYNWDGDMDSLFQQWVNSPMHNNIMSDGAYQVVGIGIAGNNIGKTYATIDFYRFYGNPSGTTTAPPGSTTTPQYTVSKRMASTYKGFEKAMGAAKGTEHALKNPDGSYQSFQNGTIYWSKSTNKVNRILNHKAAQAAKHPLGVYENYKRLGYEKKVGYPTAGQYKFKYRSSMVGQQFEKATLISLASNKYSSLQGAMQTKWKSLGWERSALGMPIAGDEKALKTAKGVYQKFEKGNLYWSSKTGAHSITGSIKTVWEKNGSERGKMGYPTTDAFKSGSYTRQNFQHGYITYKKGKTVVHS